MIRLRAMLVGLTLAGMGTTIFPAAEPALASPAMAPTPCVAGTPGSTDFDGDGRADLVVGARRWDGDEFRRQQWIQPGDGGTAAWALDTGTLRPADLNGDVCTDALLFEGGHEPWLRLAIGTPSGLDVAGATEIVLPQASDLGDDDDRVLGFAAAALRSGGSTQVIVTGNHSWGNDDYNGYIDVFTLDGALAVAHTQILPFPGFEGANTDFGQALAVSGGTFAVGVPNATVGGKRSAGAVWIYTRDDADPTEFVRRIVLTQNSAGVPGSAEAFDRFGATLAMRNGRLAVGAPDESAGSLTAAGLVQPLVWHESTRTYTAYRAISPGTPGVPGSNARRARFGSDLAIARGLTASGSYDILIGAVGATATGSVTVANVSSARYRRYTQNSRGVPGAAEPNDAFARVGVLSTSSGVETVLIGAPGERGSAGDGYAIRSDGGRLSANTAWSAIPIPPNGPPGLRDWGFEFAATS